MTLTISQYVDPGAYLSEVIVPGGLRISTVPVLPTIIANGSRTKRATNEAVQRGLVTGESLTLAGTAPHTDDLANRGNRRVTNTTVYADGVALGDAFVSYNVASVTGTNAGTFALSGGTTDAIALELDGNVAITVVFTAGAGVTTVSGTEVTVGESTIAAMGTASRAEIAAAINEALNPTDSTANTAMTDLGYGAAYAAAASDATTGVKITGRADAGPSSDVRVFDAIAQSATTTIFGVASLDAATTIEVSATVFDSGATYTVDYIAITDLVDTLAQTTPRTVIKVGAFPGVGTFVEDTDFAVDGSYDLDWTNATATGVITNATANGVAGSGVTTYDLSSTNSIVLAMDNRDPVTMDLVSGTAPLGYDTGLTAAAVTPAELAGQINALLANDDAYGPRYSAVADTTTDLGGNPIVRLTSPNDGSASSVAVTHPTSSDALGEIFGLSSTQTINTIGTGSRPTSSSVYYVTYDYPRPSGDYNNPRQFFSKDQAFAFTGPLSATNPMAVAVDIAFSNGAPTILLIQVDDTSSPGSPTRLEIQDALAAAETKSTATDIVVLDTDIGVQTDLMQHVENQSSPVEKNYRRGWFGMPRSTAIGDRDTADTFVFRATRTLQVAADSPGRGRLILVSPPGVEGINKTITIDDGTTTTLNLDSTWLAMAGASRMANFTSPAESLARKTITGFDVNEDDFTPWVRAERAALAQDGVTVVTFDAGRFILLDPTTTERGGGGLISFEQISASTQKDNVARKVTQSLDANIVGLVPTDLADFILDIKLFISNVLDGEIGSGAIGPFTDDNGNTRPIDLQRDIVVEQDPNDPTTFLFKYFFSIRYPALRLLGEYSVDNPFFQ